MTFDSLPSHGMPRRAFLIVPVAFVGLLALFRRTPPSLPDAARDGTGPFVSLVLFADNGQCTGIRKIRKLVKTDAQWRKALTGVEYAVTRRKATEFAFTNRYWNTHATGIYRCVCCGNALFASRAKFDSGTGWPSFSAPIARENIYTSVDRSLAVERTEVLCRKCDAHLGHVFDDGPPPTGTRYCLNSAAIQLAECSAEDKVTR